MAETNDCETCMGTGYVCDVCRQADGECTCDDGPELVCCDDCEAVEVGDGD